MKSNSILINISRGGLIDEGHLIRKLQSKEILGAGLDVFVGDSTINKPTDNILKLSSLENVICTPHNAYYTEESMLKLGKEIIQNIDSCLEGKPINVVN